MLTEILYKNHLDLDKLAVFDLCSLVNQYRSRSIEYSGFELSNAEEVIAKKNLLHVEELLERKISTAYLAGDDECLKCYMDITSRSYYEAEANYLSRYGDKVCFIGSGAVPHSAMVYYQKEKLKSIFVERNSEAIVLAENLLKKYYGKTIVDNYFSFNACSGENFNQIDADCRLCVIAGHCSNKQAILDHLHSVLPKNSYILLRVPRGLYRYIYEDIIRDSKQYKVVNDFFANSTILDCPIIYKV